MILRIESNNKGILSRISRFKTPDLAIRPEIHPQSSGNRKRATPRDGISFLGIDQEMWESKLISTSC
jgi:hypothetical protein